jgi:ATP-dependent Clp protease adaptor protein ClpS
MKHSPPPPLAPSPRLAAPPDGEPPRDRKPPRGGDSGSGPPGEQTVLERRAKVGKPRMYKVIFHNDDYTTMEFVVWVLREVFALGPGQAEVLMMTVHRSGRGVVGVFTRDIAETKAARVTELAELNGMPLLCTTEPED